MAVNTYWAGKRIENAQRGYTTNNNQVTSVWNSAGVRRTQVRGYGYQYGQGNHWNNVVNVWSALVWNHQAGRDPVDSVHDDYFGQNQQNWTSGYSIQQSGYSRSVQNLRENDRAYPVAKRTRLGASYNDRRYNKPYNPVRKIQCYGCERTFSSYKELHKHKDEKHPRNYYCSTCNFCCGNWAQLKDHESTHASYTCHKCPEVFKYEESLTAHVQHAHTAPRVEPNAVDSGTEADLAHDNTNAGKSSFSEPAAASTPLVENFNHSAASCQNDSGVKNESFQCPYCVKSFESEQRMNSHCKIHTEADPDFKPIQPPATFDCPLCVKKFLVRRDLFIHMSSIHTQIFYCRKCPAEFPTQSELTAHEGTDHN